MLCTRNFQRFAEKAEDDTFHQLMMLLEPDVLDGRAVALDFGNNLHASKIRSMHRGDARDHETWRAKLDENLVDATELRLDDSFRAAHENGAVPARHFTDI